MNRIMKSIFDIKKWTVLTILLALPFSTINAQESDFGNWLIYIGSKKINKKWNIHNEVQYRNFNAIGDLEQLLIRAGLGYNLTENNNNVLLGYGYILSRNFIGNTDETVNTNEHRIFQQYTTKQKVKSVSLTHRYRFEQRFIEEDFRLRFRYFLSLNIPLGKKVFDENNIDKRKLYLSAYNEIFLNGDSSIFDRNRVYGGLGYKFSKSVRVELGYLNQFLERTGRDQLNIITFVNF